MEEIVKSGFLHFYKKHSLSCEDVYPHLNGDVDLISFDHVTKECTCHFHQRKHAQILTIEIQTKFLGYLGKILTEGHMGIDSPLEEPINKIVEEFGEKGVIVLHLYDSFSIDVREYECTFQFLAKLNLVTTKLLCKKYHNICFDHIRELTTKYRSSWRKLGKSKWKEFCVESMKMAKFTYFPLDFIQQIAKEYDNKILSQAIEIYGEKFRMGLLDDTELRDALGLPFVPYGGKPDLLPRLEKALESPQIIIETTRKWNEEQLRQYIEGVRIACTCEPQVMNTTNLIGDSIDDYPPGQIIRCCTTNGKIYQYTLSEAREMIRTLEDPYTRQKIDPLEFFSTIIQRGKGHVEGTIEYILQTILNPDPLLA